MDHMDTLRSRLIRLAHQNPDIRPHILPIITAADTDAGSLAKAVANGWDELTGGGLAKAQSVTGAKVTLAKKFGRKTVFARLHGTVSLYVVQDDGTVSEEWFASFPSDADVSKFLAGATRTAALSLVKKKVNLPTYGGKSVETDALVTGPWGVHKNLSGGKYAVTFLPTGQTVSTGNPTLGDAKLFLEALLEQAPDLARANDVSDVMRHKDVIVGLLKAPPSVPGRAPRPPKVSETREKLIGDIKTQGLVSMGTRSGTDQRTHPGHLRGCP